MSSTSKHERLDGLVVNFFKQLEGLSTPRRQLDQVRLNNTDGHDFVIKEYDFIEFIEILLLITKFVISRFRVKSYHHT